MEINCNISQNVLDLLDELGYITDYTYDGWVYIEYIGWLPLSDIFENLFLSEKEIRVERTRQEQSGGQT